MVRRPDGSATASAASSAATPRCANARVLLRGLNYPGGLAVAEGQLWFTESFGHRLSRAAISAAGSIGAPQIVIRNMPGYPSRLGRSSDGGFVAQPVWRAHAFDRVRPARGRFSRGDDAHHSKQNIGWRRRFRTAAIASSRCSSAASRRSEFRSLGRRRGPTDWSRGSIATAKRWRACTAGLAAVTTASPRRSKRRRASLSYPRAAAACCSTSGMRDHERDERSASSERRSAAGIVAPTGAERQQGQQDLWRRSRHRSRRFRPIPRRGPCAGRRERRRQIDAVQGDRRRHQADIRHLLRRRQAGRFSIAARRADCPAFAWFTRRRAWCRP